MGCCYGIAFGWTSPRDGYDDGPLALYCIFEVHTQTSVGVQQGNVSESASSRIPGTSDSKDLILRPSGSRVIHSISRFWFNGSFRLLRLTPTFQHSLSFHFNGISSSSESNAWGRGSACVVLAIEFYDYFAFITISRFYSTTVISQSSAFEHNGFDKIIVICDVNEERFDRIFLGSRTCKNCKKFECLKFENRFENSRGESDFKI